MLLRTNSANKILLSIMIMVGMLISDMGRANMPAGMQMFQARRYSAAANLFFQSVSYPKTREEKQDALWFLAQSLEQLGLLYSASKYYSVIVRGGYKAKNPYFRKAMDKLGALNSTLSLGQAHIVQLFSKKLDAAAVPQAARGFYFYYQGVEQFSKKSYAAAKRNFSRVPTGSPYYVDSLFHQGVIANLAGQHSKAVSLFERVRGAVSPRGKTQAKWEMANLNLARIHYETKRYPMALQYYRQIPRDSDNWLKALWEASWAFFMMDDHNNTLGVVHTLHSPFFKNRFYPESYILQSITFLRLCRFEEVKNSLRAFRNRYSDVFKDLKSMLGKYRRKSSDFYKLIADYRAGNRRAYPGAAAILDQVSRSDSFKEGADAIRFSMAEANQLNRYASAWRSTGLLDELQSFLKSKKNLAASDAGERLYSEAASYLTYLDDLSDQARLIQEEMLLGKVNALRKKLNVAGANRNTIEFIGGLQPIKLASDLEYWPFMKNEYWEDELGYYKYNIESKCSVSKGGR